MSSPKSAPSIAPGEGSFQLTVVHENFDKHCNLESVEWLKLVAAITLIVSLALVAFLACYAAGIFHFETFIGHIGTAVSLSGAAALVVFSAAVLYLSFKVRSKPQP